MKEKYDYDTVNDTSAAEGLIFFAAVGLMIYLFMKGDHLDRRIFWILVFISGSVLAFFIGRILVSVRFSADDNAVTFSRIFRKRIPYSSIKSIDLRTETRSFKKKKTKYQIVTYTGVTEIITFHCEDGDHSFAGILVPSHEENKPSGVSAEDMANSKFSRLKNYIEERIPIMSAEKI